MKYSPKPAFVDDAAGHGVDVLGRHPRPHRRHRRLLGGQENGVAVATSAPGSPVDHRPGDVGAVADVGSVVVLAAEVADHHLARPDPPGPGLVVGAGPVGPTAHDGEVHLPMTGGQQPGRDVLRHFGLGPPHQCDLTGLQLGRHRSAAWAAARELADLVGVLHRPQRRGDRRRRSASGRRAAVPGRPAATWPRPGRRCRWWPSGAAEELDGQRHRVLGLGPGAQREGTPRPSGTRGASRPGTTRTASPSRGQHQHGEPLQRHGPVAGEPGQVGPVREQQGVDTAGSPCCCPHPVEPGPPGRVGPATGRRLTSGPSAVSCDSADATGVADGAAPPPGRGSSSGSAVTTGRGRSPWPRRSRRSGSNSSGVHHRATGRWAALGRRYCPMVTMSTPTRPEVGQRAHHFVLGLPHPRMIPDLTVKPGRLGPGQHGQAAGVTGRGPDGPLQPGHRLQVVVEDVGPGPDRSWRRACSSPLQSGTRTSTAVPGQRRRMASMVATKPAAPPSSRSSRATAVTTAWARPSRSTASATRSGSSGSMGSGMTGVDQAEPAGPGAPLPVDHEGGRAVGPALEDVRAAGLLAHRHQIEVPHRPTQAEEVVTHPGRDPQPRRLAFGQGQSPVGIDTGLTQPDPQPARRAPRLGSSPSGARRRSTGGRARQAAGQSTSWRSTTPVGRPAARRP